MQTNAPTTEMAQSLQNIFDYLNKELFENNLPQAMVVVTRNGKVIGGYYSPEQWENEAGIKVPEIGINSNVIADGNPVEVLGILVHEMIHLWQHVEGNAGRPGYHNKHFAAKCDELGLSITCLDKDAKEGQKVGQAINTQLTSGGKAELIIAQMAVNPSLDFSWWTSKTIDIDDQGQPQEIPQDGGGAPGQQKPQQKEPKEPKKRAGKRTKYHCAICGLNAWAKAGVSLFCGACQRPMIPMV